MAAERFSNDVLQTFYEPVMPEQVMEEPGDNEFKMTRTDFHEWFHVWKMDAPRTDDRDIFVLQKETKNSLLMM